METERRKKSNLKWWFITAGVLVLVVGPVMFVVMSKTGLQRRLDRMRADGIPTSFAELEEYCKLPSGTENAADIYQQAFNIYSKPGQDQMKLLPVYSADIDKLEMPLADDTKNVINEYLEANKECIELIYRAGKIKDCHFPFKYSPQGDIMLLHLGELRNFMRLLTCRMIMQAESNDKESMIANFRAQAGVADSLKNEPVLISHLVRIACWSMFTTNVEFALNNVSFSKDQLEQIQSLLPDIEDENGLERSMLGEQCFLIEATQNPQILQGSFPAAGRIFLSSTGLLDKNCLKYLDIMEQYQAAAKLVPKEQLKKLDELDRQVDELPVIYLFVKMIFPSLHRIYEINMRYHAYMIDTHTALAVERYVTDTGNIPESLDKLVDKYIDRVPIDLDGQRLRYIADPNGYTIYSLGADMVDEGGKKRDKKKGSESYDVTFTVLKRK